MNRVDREAVERIRFASRHLVRALGFMDATLAGTSLSPSAVHAIIEIGAAGGTSARDLADSLRLDKSTVSRMLKRLIREGYLAETRDARDTRVKRLSLTDRGVACLAGITDFAVDQVGTAIAPLSADAVETIAAGLETYASALTGAASARTAATARLVPGYRPGILGTMLAMHGEYYAAAAGFGAPFETRLAADMAAFFARLDHPANGFWTAEIDGHPVGTIAIDGEDLGAGLAHLRWFIMADQARGRGIGAMLIDAALDFVDERGVHETRLWTFAGLDAARRLYERRGFVLADERPGRQWGAEVMEQEFRRTRPGA
ncbi:bifunctional helix-turn-helix transcriptional regulator/GNAT family N-acetyltransferase [Acuticoccus sp. M5D2P5]|uniref:helix-turn-helix domain-containing GNAT family N-acetyltransferase n=1 Tax=Acuticoccus kalidii TaxID=2910977 RepID=UPI001F3CC3CA|nr:bifunctional helix-turn-helix transcriptional regulator/GNAT family N-acetyltransferase [Acuticoccus kalidii]MCF3932442.1 bifunctional helix-turn-helix transcriptional regulator/GNAT family N-acetyltransferase [Acuticoccus kalidii]